jgi:tungstate transport system substrate-binding protein
VVWCQDRCHPNGAELRRTLVLAAAIAVVAISCSGNAGERVIVAAGTTLVDSGFLGLLVEQYEAGAPDDSISVVGLSSAQATAYADAGNADLMITHDAVALGSFLERSPSAASEIAFVSRFLVVAPQGVVPASEDATAAFRFVSETATPFVSRDDGSGTHAREQLVWASVPFDPSGEGWYIRTGTGMGATLLVADQLAAATLTELGAYLDVADILSLVEVQLANDDDLANPYDITVVDSSGSPGAVAFMQWLLSDAGRGAITLANKELFGTQVYEVP